MGKLNVFKIPWIKIEKLPAPFYDKELWAMVNQKDPRFISLDRKRLRKIDPEKYKIVNLLTKEEVIIDKLSNCKSTLNAMKNSIENMSNVKDIRSERLKRNSNTNQIEKYGFLWSENETDMMKKLKVYLDSLSPSSPKKPLASSNYIGIEIEMGSNINRESVFNVLREFNIHKNIEIKDDGSIRCGRYQVELACIFHEKKLNNILKLCNVINSAPISAEVDGSCGLHVHIDMRNRDRILVKNRFLNMENILFNMMPIERRRNRYCVRSNTLTDNERYRWFNVLAYERHRTYEIRLHNGTTRGEDILNWTKLMIAIADTPQPNETNVSTYISFDDMLQKVSYGDDLNRFILNETRRYNG